MAHHIYFFLIWIVASFFNGITGSGGAMLALPVTALFMPATLLVPTTAIFVLLISAYMVAVYWRYCHFPTLIRMLIGVLPGVLLGSYILVYVPARFIQLSVGGILIVFVLWQMLQKKKVSEYRTNTFYALIAGFSSGFLNGSIAFAGPPLILYALYAGWDTKTTFGTTHCTNIITTIVTTFAHYYAGLYTQEMFTYLAWGTPAVLIGLTIAKPLVAKLDIKLFTLILRLTILISGTVCVFRAI